MNLPIEYINEMKKILGNEYEAYIQSFNEVRYAGIRRNALKINEEQFENLMPFELEKVPWTDMGYYIEQDIKPAKHPFYHAGLYYIQEPSAMFPVAQLPINENDRVLDLCAAPGGKSTQIASKLKNTGILVSNDYSFSRSKAVVKNIELNGVKNAIVLSENPSKLVSYFLEYFDKILVDAPCSGEGMFRKDKVLISSWEERGPQYYSEIQKEILKSAALMLKVEGYLLYSTCTFSVVENEEVIEWFLTEFPEYELVNIYKDHHVEKGIHNEMVARLWPHKLKGEGHFAALLVKSDTSELSPYSLKKNKKENRKISKNNIQQYRELEKKLLNNSIDDQNFYQLNDQLYWVPEQLPNLKGLRVLRQGWLLGENTKYSFEPSQAFAMGLDKKNMKNPVNLRIDDPNVLKYLKGESIEVEELKEKGYNLICVEGYPLGFGKKTNRLIKNKYPVAWKYE